MPAGSVAVTVKFCGPPSARAILGVTFQVPSAATVVVSVSPFGVTTVMVSPGLPVPLMVGVTSEVVLSPSLPVSEPGSNTAPGAAGAEVSIVTGTVVAGLVLPAGSVWVTEKFCGPPVGSAVVGVTLQLPSAATTVFMTSPPGLVTVIVLPGVAPAPLMVGVVSAVVLSPLIPVSDAGAKTAPGARGAVLSMVTGKVAVAVFPAGSVSVIPKLAVPSGIGVAGVTLQVPSAATTVVNTSPVGVTTSILLPGVPVPLIVGVVSLVMPSPTVPLSELLSSLAVGLGPVTSTVIVSGAAGLVLPAGSVAVTLKVFGPSGNACVRVTDQVPSLLTVVVRISPVGLMTLMVSPGVPPAPLITGLTSLVMLSPLVPVSEPGLSTGFGAAGAVVSMVTG